MNCSDWEERIALYAGGDLPPAQAHAVERHILECAGCQLLLSGLRQSLGMLREAHAEPVEAAHFAAVRARVLSELARGYRPWWRQAWVYATVLAAMAMLVAVWPKPQKKSMAQARTGVETSDGGADPLVRRRRPGRSARVTPVAAGLGRPVARRAAPRGSAPPKPESAKPAEQLVVKLLTDDPDVIIYWITDSKGD
jgi:hypothetical protein